MVLKSTKVIRTNKNQNKSGKLNGQSKSKSKTRKARKPLAKRELVSITTAPSAWYSIIQQGARFTGVGRKMTAKFADIVLSVSGSASNTQLAGVVSCNPAAHYESMLHSISQPFAMYKPKSIVAHWIPKCGTNTAGSVVMGTIWSETDIIPTDANSLLTTRAGISFPVWQPGKIRIPLDTLPQKYFSMKLETHLDSEPFVQAVMIEDGPTSGALGQLMWEWEYEFVDPIVRDSVEGSTQTQTVNTVGQSSAGPLEITLPDETSWKSIVLSYVPATLQSYLETGMRYMLSKSGTDKYHIMDGETFQPITTSTTISSAALLASLAFKYSLPSIPVVTESLKRTSDKEDFLQAARTYQIIPPVEQLAPPLPSTSSGCTPRLRK